MVEAPRLVTHRRPWLATSVPARRVVQNECSSSRSAGRFEVFAW